jgi:hypothetical protein
MKNITIIITIILALGVFLIISPVMAENRVIAFEMGESGQMVSFPLTADEIVAEDAEIARLKAAQNIRVPKSESDFVIFELAESGETIEFPVKGVEILTEGIAKNIATVEADEENTPNN